MKVCAHDWEPVRIIDRPENKRAYPHPTWAICRKCNAEKGQP